MLIRLLCMHVDVATLIKDDVATLIKVGEATLYTCL